MRQRNFLRSIRGSRATLDRHFGRHYNHKEAGERTLPETAKGLRTAFLLYLQSGVDKCQLTVHSQKLEKSDHKLQKSRPKRKRRPAQRTGQDATTKKESCSFESQGKTGCNIPFSFVSDFQLFRNTSTRQWSYLSVLQSANRVWNR